MTHVWDLLPHQDDLVYSKASKCAMICGRGAGKSYALSYLTLRDFVEGKNVLVGAQSVDTLHDSLWTEIKERAKEAGIHDFIDWHERPMRAYFNGATIYTGTYEAVDVGPDNIVDEFNEYLKVINGIYANDKEEKDE